MNKNNDGIKKQLIESLTGELPVLRAKGRLSQEDIAEAIGMSRQTYGSIETGKREMSWKTFLALIAFFQNNDNTKIMINNMDEIIRGINIIVRSSGSHE